MRNQEKLLAKTNIILIREEKNDRPTNLKLGLFIQDNGKVASETDMENSNGLMVPNILESGRKTEHTEKDNLFMLTVIFMMGSGLMIKLMASESINM